MNRVKYTIMHSMDEIATPCQSDKCPVILIDCDAQSACYEYAQRLQDRIMYCILALDSGFRICNHIVQG